MLEDHKASNVPIRYQCSWCGFDSREGEHGLQEDRPDGGVNILCKVVMQVWHPTKSWRIEGVTEGQ